MTIKLILESLTGKGIISRQQAELIAAYEQNKAFSVYRELRFLLYAGILLLTSGLGILIYKNIETIGHQFVIFLIAASALTCFYYVFRLGVPFTSARAIRTEPLADYLLLLGCTLFLILEGYLQFQYQFFGPRYGLAIFIPTLLFFFCAYRFDHRGVLSMAVTGLASWLGLTISPLSVLKKNDFTTPGLINTGIILGISLILISLLSEKRDVKKHFAFTYLLLGGNLATVAGMAGLFGDSGKLIYFLVSITLCLFFIRYARGNQSLLFLLMGVIYGYITISYAAFRVLPPGARGIVSICYFLFTSIGVLFFLLNIRKILKLKNEKSIS
jgi:hypothetical protein